jgi:hypothetical protein
VRVLRWLLTGLPADGTCDVLKRAAECLTSGERFVNVRLVVRSELVVTGQWETAKGWLIQVFS